MRKITFAAVLVFMGLVGATVWTMRQTPNRGITYVTLSDITPDSIDRIELTGAAPGVLEKRDDAWYLGSGRLADISQVKNLLKSAEHIQSSDVLTHDSSRYAEYDVDAAKGTGVRLLGGGHELAHITVGRALSGGMAIRKGDAAYKVNGVFPNAFVHNANEWMERRLFLQAPTDDVTRVEVALRDEAPYALVRTDAGWTLVQGKGDKPVADFRTDPAGVQRLVHELSQVRADVLLDADPGDAITGLGRAVDKLTFELKPENADEKHVRRTLLVGATGDNKSRFVRVEGSPDVAVLPGYAAVNLRKTRESLRDLRLNKPVNMAQVKGLEIRRAAQRLALVRKGQTWTLPDGVPVPSGTQIDHLKAQRRAMDVSNARAASMAKGITPAQAGIAAREGQAKITLDDNSSVAIIFGRKAAGNQVYVQGAADGRVYLVNAALRDHILGMLETLRKDGEGDPLARFDQDGVGSLPPDVRAGLSEHFAQKKREQQAQQLLKARRPERE